MTGMPPATLASKSRWRAARAQREKARPVRGEQRLVRGDDVLAVLQRAADERAGVGRSPMSSTMTSRSGFAVSAWKSV